jgi:hypothetical protein
MTINTIARFAGAAALATVLSLAASQACFAGSRSEGVGNLTQAGSGYFGYSGYVPGTVALVPPPDYTTPFWAPDPALQWEPQ